MKFSLPVILLDEFLKIIARNHAHGKDFTVRQWSEVLAILVAFTAYGYGWFLHEVYVHKMKMGNER